MNVTRADIKRLIPKNYRRVRLGEEIRNTLYKQIKENFDYNGKSLGLSIESEFLHNSWRRQRHNVYVFIPKNT